MKDKQMGYRQSNGGEQYKSHLPRSEKVADMFLRGLEYHPDNTAVTDQLKRIAETTIFSLSELQHAKIRGNLTDFGVELLTYHAASMGESIYHCAVLYNRLLSCGG